MARKAQKSAEPTVDELIARMYPTLPTSDDFEEKRVDVKQTPAATDSATAATLAALREQVARLEGQIASTSRPVAPTAQQPTMPQRPVIDYTKFPDPVQEPAAYAQAVSQATQAQIEYEKQVFMYQQKAQQAQQSQTAALWDEFGREYKEHAAQPERVEIAAERVITKARAQGLDTEKYMANSKAFLKAVADEMDRLWPKADADFDGDEGDTIEDVDDDDNRAQVFGGAAAQRGGPAAVKAPPQKYGALGQEILNWQTKNGFMR